MPYRRVGRAFMPVALLRLVRFMEDHMNFNEEELFYLKKLLTNHSLDLLDLVMNDEEKRDMAKEILKINSNCMEKLNEK